MTILYELCPLQRTCPTFLSDFSRFPILFTQTKKNPVTMKPSFLLLVIPVLLTAPASAAITVIRDSSDFQGTLDQIEGDVDPASLSSFQNHPSYPAPNLSLNGDGTMTVTVPDDTYPNWNLPAGNFLDSATGWTWETRFRIDAANDPDRGVWEIFLRDNDSDFAATRIHFLASGIDPDSDGNGVNALVAADLTDGFHVVRGAVEGGTNLTTVWLDGVKVIDAQPSNTFVASEGGWVGRWGAQTRGGATTIDYLRFDTTGAFAPVPEPSTAVLMAVALAFGFRRHR